PPCGGGTGRGVRTRTALVLYLTPDTCRVVESVHGISLTLSALSPPLSLSLPRKGGGNRVARVFATHPLRLRLRAPPLSPCCSCPRPAGPSAGMARDAMRITSATGVGRWPCHDVGLWPGAMVRHPPSGAVVLSYYTARWSRAQAITGAINDAPRIKSRARANQ